MKQVMLWAAMLLAQCAGAQTAQVIFQWDNCDVSDMSWELLQVSTGQVVQSGGGYFCYAQEVVNFPIEPGQYFLTVNNPVVTNVGRGFFLLSVCSVPVYVQLYPFDSVNGASFFVADQECACDQEADDCPADINEDGVVGVADLIVFIGEFVCVCE